MPAEQSCDVVLGLHPPSVAYGPDSMSNPLEQ
jgi:hypothetical protein